MSLTIPGRFAEAMAGTENERWQDAAAAIEAYRGEAGDYVFSQIRATANGVDDAAFWRWIDILEKIQVLCERAVN